MTSLSEHFEVLPNVNLVGMDEHFERYSERFERVALYIKDVCGAKATITSAHDGTHSKNSLHSVGLAIDLRTRNLRGNIWMIARSVAWILGEPWVVILESNHLHIQASTKNIKSPETLEVIGGACFGSSIRL
jgi:hypothetical protein